MGLKESEVRQGIKVPKTSGTRVTTTVQPSIAASFQKHAAKKLSQQFWGAEY